MPRNRPDQLRCALFDCDGVVADSEVLYVSCVCDHLHELGVEVGLNEVSDVVGMRSERIFATLKERFDVLRELSNEEIRAGQNRHFDRRVGRGELVMMPGVDRLLSALDERGVACILVSSSPRGYLVDLLDRFGLSRYFEGIVSGEQVKESKPDPEIYLRGLWLGGAKAGEAVAIEDSFNGIRSAEAAGIFTIGFKGSELVLNTSEADVELDSHDSVRRYLLG